MAEIVEKLVRAADGTALQATWYLPKTKPERVLLINSATGALQALYRHFACWLAERGVAALTYDYRGIGVAHDPALLRNKELSFADWGTLDYAAMLAEANRCFPDTPLTVLGHSIGGMIVGFAPLLPLERLVTIGAQTCFWRDWRISHIPLFLSQWALIMPMATRLAGYFPGSKLGYPCDLPAGIAYQWSRGCFTPDFTLDARPHSRDARDARPWAALFAQFSAPIVAISFDDDAIGTPRAVDRLLKHFSSAPVKRVRWSAQDFGLRKVGHFGFAGRHGAAQIWPAILQLATAS